MFSLAVQDFVFPAVRGGLAPSEFAYWNPNFNLHTYTLQGFTE